MVRDDIPDVHEQMVGNASHPEFGVILGGEYSYTLHWKDQVPNHFQVEGFGVEALVIKQVI